MNTARQQKLDELRAKAQSLSQKITAIEEEERNETARPRLRALVGKCFVYHNAGGDSVEGKWPLYAKIIGFDEKKMTFQAVQFQTWKTSYCQRVEIEDKREYNYDGRSRFGVDHGWEPISEAIYDLAREKMLRQVLESFGKTQVSART